MCPTHQRDPGVLFQKLARRSDLKRRNNATSLYLYINITPSLFRVASPVNVALCMSSLLIVFLVPVFLQHAHIEDSETHTHTSTRTHHAPTNMKKEVSQTSVIPVAMTPSYRTGQRRRRARQHHKLARLVPHTHSPSPSHQPRTGSNCVCREPVGTTKKNRQNEKTLACSIKNWSRLA